MERRYKVLPTAPPMDEHTLLLKRPMYTALQEQELQAVQLLLPVAKRVSRTRCDCPLTSPREERHPREDEWRCRHEPQDEEDRGGADDDDAKKAFFMFGLELSIPRLVSCKIKVKLSC